MRRSLKYRGEGCDLILSNNGGKGMRRTDFFILLLTRGLGGQGLRYDSTRTCNRSIIFPSIVSSGSGLWSRLLCESSRGLGSG